MITKDKVNQILNGRDEKEEKIEIPEEPAYLETAKKSSYPLVVVLTTEQQSLHYTYLKEIYSDILFCEDIRYLNSINHLDNVKKIIVDLISFNDEKEVAFLIRMFELLHREAEIVIGAEDKDLLIPLKKLVLDNKRVRGITWKDDEEFLLQGVIDTQDKRKKPIGKILKKVMATLLMVTGLLVTGYYCFFQRNDQEADIHNRNLNVQLDMGDITILPIETLYADENGGHVVIEEVSNVDNSKVKISLFDDERKPIVADEQISECPNGKCKHHHLLTFTIMDNAGFYILQIDNGNSIKNVEIDNRYFN